jgi:Arm domain-containing DNA-binding protein
LETAVVAHFDAPEKGSIYKRCTCPAARDASGRRVDCPQPHGSWSFILDVGTDRATGKRKQVKRGGFPTQAAAHEALNVALEALRKTTDTLPRSRFYQLAAAEMLAEDANFLRLSGAAGHVYVFRANQYLKIGYSKRPGRRISEVRQRPSDTHRLVEPADLDRKACMQWLAIVGSRADEKAIQWLARNYHVAGEWYYADQALVDCLAQIATDRVVDAEQVTN